MKREFFGLLFIVIFLIVYLTIEKLCGTDVVSKFIVVWILIAFFMGQYSTKYPKL